MKLSALCALQSGLDRRLRFRGVGAGHPGDAHDPPNEKAECGSWEIETRLALLINRCRTTEHRMDQMAALSHLRALIKAAKGKNDVAALHQALQEMLQFVEKTLGRKG
jgi:hypothetical protein